MTLPAPQGVDPETGEVAAKSGVKFPAKIRLAHQPMNEDEAREVTSKIKAYAVSICHLVRDAHNGHAWKPLGYDDWTTYLDAEFGMTRQRAHQLIAYADKIDMVAGAIDVIGDVLEAELSERATRGLPAEVLEAAASTAVDALPDDATDQAKAEAVAAAVKEAKPPAPVKHTETTTTTTKIQTEFSSGTAPASDDTEGARQASATDEVAPVDIAPEAPAGTAASTPGVPAEDPVAKDGGEAASSGPAPVVRAASTEGSGDDAASAPLVPGADLLPVDQPHGTRRWEANVGHALGPGRCQFTLIDTAHSEDDWTEGKIRLTLGFSEAESLAAQVNATARPTTDLLPPSSAGEEAPGPSPLPTAPVLDLDALRVLSEAATDGGWKFTPHEDVDGGEITTTDGYWVTGDIGDEDGPFVCAAVNYVRSLLDGAA